MSKISVIAEWNAEHQVWTATSEDVIGLHVETDTYEELLDIVPDLVADLLSFGQWPEPEFAPVPVEILTCHQSLARPHEQ